MADEQIQSEEQGGGKGKMVLVIGLVGALLVGGGVAFAVAMMMGGGDGNKKAAPAAPQVPAQGAAQVPAQGPAVAQTGLRSGPPTGPLVPFETVIVNLNEPGGTRYLKATFQVEVSSKGVEKELEKVKIPVKDALIEYLSSLTLSETQSMDAKRKIKLNIINRINRFLTTGRVLNIYFTEFVVQ